MRYLEVEKVAPSFLIVGGSGFLGIHLANELLSSGYYVRSLGRRLKPSCFNESTTLDKFEWVQGDYSDLGTLNNALKGIDYVAHLASTTIPKTSNDNPAKDILDNLIPSIQLIEQAAIHKVKKLIYFSSGGTVYGTPEKILIEEDDPTNPLCSYGIHKLAVEKYLKYYENQLGLNYAIMRIANPYGPGQNGKNGQGVVGTFLNKISRAEAIEIWGDGRVIRDYIHVEDVCIAAKLLFQYEGKERVFNIGAGYGASVNDILSMIEYWDIKINKVYKDSRSFDVRNNVLNINRIKNEVGWTPKRSLESYIKKEIKKIKYG